MLDGGDVMVLGERGAERGAHPSARRANGSAVGTSREHVENELY